MRKSSWLVLAVVAVLAAGLVALKIAGKPQLSDSDQIRALLVKGETAIEQKDLKATMSCVSRAYRDPSGIKFDQLRVQAIQAFQQEGEYDVMLEDADIQVQGKTATVSLKVTMGMVAKGSMHQIFSSPVTIRLAKDDVKHWLVLVSEEWKITSLEGMPTGYDE